MKIKFYCQVLVQGFATAEIEAKDAEEAKEKMYELDHDDFEIDYATMNFDDSPKYRELFDEDGNNIVD